MEVLKDKKPLLFLAVAVYLLGMIFIVVGTKVPAIFCYMAEGVILLYLCSLASKEEESVEEAFEDYEKRVTPDSESESSSDDIWKEEKEE